MHLTLQQLKLFEAVARNNSFTRAAEELFLTQPAVSIQVQRLEDNVGLPLFDQIGKRIFLTKAGQILYDTSRDLLARLETMKKAVTDLKGEIKGSLQLAVVTTAKYFMPHLLGAFLQLYPQVVPRLTVTNRERVIERLTNNVDDLLIMGQVPENLGVEVYPFLENVLVVAATPKHALVGEKNISLKRLAKERFLAREPGSGTRLAVQRLFAEQGLKIEPYMELGSSEAIKQGVIAGLGLSVLSLYNLRLELANQHLAVLDVVGFPLRRPWYAAHLKGKQLSLVARTFLDFILVESARILLETTEPLSEKH